MTWKAEPGMKTGFLPNLGGVPYMPFKKWRCARHLCGVEKDKPDCHRISDFVELPYCTGPWELNPYFKEDS